MPKVLEGLQRRVFHDVAALRILPDWFEIETTSAATERFHYGRKQVRLLDARSEKPLPEAGGRLATFLYFPAPASVHVETGEELCMIAVNRLPATLAEPAAG